MIDHAALIALVSHYGLWILTPLAVVEGPIATVIAAYLARQSILDLTDVIVCVIAADMIGDSLLYLVGRHGLGRLPASWRERFGLTRKRVFSLMRSFRRNDVRILIVGKITHAAGFAVLAVAGAVRMPFLRFLAINLVATIPKSLFFVAVGYLFGSAHEVISRWISFEGLLLFALILVVVALVLHFNRRKTVK